MAVVDRSRHLNGLCIKRCKPSNFSTKTAAFMLNVREFRQHAARFMAARHLRSGRRYRKGWLQPSFSITHARDVTTLTSLSERSLHRGHGTDAYSAA